MIIWYLHILFDKFKDESGIVNYLLKCGLLKWVATCLFDEGVLKAVDAL